MDIQIQVNDQPVNAYLALPAAGTGPGLLVLHAWWGLTPFFKEFCDRLAAQGFVALAPDLFHGSTASTVAAAQAQVDAADSQDVGATVTAAKDFLLSHPAHTGEKIGAIGFSFGAAWALVAATHTPQPFAATVVFYGAYTGLDFDKMQSKFLGHFSDVDEWEPLEGIQAMQQEMGAAGVDATYQFYPGLPHWFFENNRPEYNPPAAALSWERTISFLNDNL